MPIEIRELIIKTTIEDGQQQNEPIDQSFDILSLKEQIIEECIERTLEIMERKAER